MIQLGDFGDIDFSATQAMIDKINAMQAAKQAYQPCSVPSSVQDYKAGSFVDGKWNKTLDFAMDNAVKAYEACGDNKTRTLAALVFGTDPDKPLTDDQALANLAKIADINALQRDVLAYKDYLQTKWQQTKGWTTPQFATAYYKEYFNGWSNYSRLNALVSKESSRRSKDMQVQSQLLQSDVKFAFGKAYLEFYTTALQKYGPQFSEYEQQKLRKFFVEETPMMWTPEEFYEIGMMLKGKISAVDWAQFATSITGTVATSMFEDAGGGMSNYLKRTKDFGDALMRMGGATAADLPTPQIAQSKGISLPAAAALGLASYLAWKALK